jgi:hypothetical protein
LTIHSESREGKQTASEAVEEEYEDPETILLLQHKVRPRVSSLPVSLFSIFLCCLHPDETLFIVVAVKLPSLPCLRIIFLYLSPVYSIVNTRHMMYKLSGHVLHG